MKDWLIFAKKGQYGVCCGECGDKLDDSFELITKCVVDCYFYYNNCEICQKNAGDYFAHYKKWGPVDLRYKTIDQLHCG